MRKEVVLFNGERSSSTAYLGSGGHIIYRAFILGEEVSSVHLTRTELEYMIKIMDEAEL